jgi:glucose dehydrogenase
MIWFWIGATESSFGSSWNERSILWLVALLDMVSSRKRRWDLPLGSPLGLADSASAAKIPAGLGSPNLGGPMVTGGGLVFIGAALDLSLHAYNVENGRELWRGGLPTSGKTTPMSYQPALDEQFVSVVPRLTEKRTPTSQQSPPN